MQANTEREDVLAFVIAFIFVTASFFAAILTFNGTEKQVTSVFSLLTLHIFGIINACILVVMVVPLR